MQFQHPRTFSLTIVYVQPCESINRKLGKILFLPSLLPSPPIYFLPEEQWTKG